MTILQELRIDVFQHRLKAQTQSTFFNLLADDVAHVCGIDAGLFFDLLEDRHEERLFRVDRGSSVFDMQSPVFAEQVLAVSTFDRGLEFSSSDPQKTDILMSVFSPTAYGPKHLQKVAQVSRILKADDFCAALRDARDVDAMRVLFLPRQSWMEAA